MPSSMTAFARHSIECHWGTAAWEIRSVNHRYLETGFRMPETVRDLEATLRELTRNSQYPLDLRAGVGADVGRAVFTALFLTEIDTSGQFTYDDDVDADQQFFFYR